MKKKQNNNPPNMQPEQQKPVTAMKKGRQKKNKFSKQNGSAAKNKKNPSSGPLIRHSVDSKWFQHQFNATVSKPTGDLSAIEVLRQEAEELFQKDVASYFHESRQRKPGEFSWLKTAASSGTQADRVASLTIQVQNSPVHHLSSLDTLLTSLGKKGRRELLMSIETLKELFVQDLLPKERKLVPFDLRDLLSLATENSSDVRQRKLILWFYEDQLRAKYRQFLDKIVKLTQDTVEAIRMKAAQTLQELLISRPEQEKFLLCSLVNKLGDVSYKVGSKVANLLQKVVEQHPNMKAVIVADVERLIYRPNVGLRAQFYAVCFLSQLMLKTSEIDLAAKLLEIYFSLFKMLVGSGEVENRMLSVLLSGTNRAFPYAKGRVDSVLKEVDTLYKLVAVSRLGVSLQTLMLLYQLLDSSEGVSERYYCALYKKLTESILLTPGGNHHPLLFNLLHKTIKGDPVDTRVNAFLKRLLQVSLHERPPFVCGALILVSSVMKERPSILRLQKSAQSAALMGGPQKLVATKFDDDSDEEEHFTDAHGPESDGERPEMLMTKTEHDSQSQKTDGRPSATWVHRNNMKVRGPIAGYDMWHRNPLFCGADTALDVELTMLASHFHPSVALFAQTLLNRQLVEYDGDPLQDFTLMRFLDRFVYRNPKTKTQRANVGTKSTAATSARIGSRRRAYDPLGVKKLAANSDEYVKQQAELIPADERFLYRYAQFLTKPQRKPGEQEESDVESVDSDEFDTMLAKFEPGKKNEEFSVDFSREFSTGKSTKKRRKEADDDESSGDESGEDEMDMDEEDEELSGQSDSATGPSASHRRANRNKSGKQDIAQLFASAEQFAEILENAANSDDDDEDGDRKKRGKKLSKQRLKRK